MNNYTFKTKEELLDSGWRVSDKGGAFEIEIKDHGSFWYPVQMHVLFGQEVPDEVLEILQHAKERPVMIPKGIAYSLGLDRAYGICLAMITEEPQIEF